MANILHKIKAYLYDSLSVQDICNAAVSRGGADVSASAMAHANLIKCLPYSKHIRYYVRSKVLTCSGVKHSLRSSEGNYLPRVKKLRII